MLFFVCCIDVLVKLHVTYSVVVVVVVVVVRGIVRIIQKDDPGLIFVPFFLFALLHALRKNSV